MLRLHLYPHQLTVVCISFFGHLCVQCLQNVSFILIILCAKPQSSLSLHEAAKDADSPKLDSDPVDSGHGRGLK